MRHIATINGKAVVVEIGCGHPDIENNNCPIEYGECWDCEYCVTKMKTKDMLALQD